MYKNIPVSPDVHTRVKEIAKSNFRGLGDQIAFWVQSECDHPLETRKSAFTLFVDEDTKIPGFFCTECNRFIFE